MKKNKHFFKKHNKFGLDDIYDDDDDDYGFDLLNNNDEDFNIHSNKNHIELNKFNSKHVKDIIRGEHTTLNVTVNNNIDSSNLDFLQFEESNCAINILKNNIALLALNCLHTMNCTSLEYIKNYVSDQNGIKSFIIKFKKFVRSLKDETNMEILTVIPILLNLGLKLSKNDAIKLFKPYMTNGTINKYTFEQVLNIFLKIDYLPELNRILDVFQYLKKDIKG